MTDGDAAGAPSQVTPIEAAYQQLAKFGPVTDGRTISLSGVARALGMSRSNLYRRWSTSADLAADIAVHRATPADGWHAQVCADDGATLEDALRRALASPASAEGVLTRASIAMSPSSTAHAPLAAWERAHLANLVERLKREWGAAVDGPWTDAAIATAALIEGMHLMWAQVAEEPGQLMPAGLAEETTQTVLRIIEFLLHEAEGVDSPVGADDPEANPDSTTDRALPARVAEALTDGTLDLTDEGGRRLIDMGILARSRGVSERSLYARWPTAADLNADLYRESVQRVRDAYGRILIEVFQSNASGEFPNVMPFVARMNAWFMDPERFPEGGVHLGLTDVLSSSDVLDRVREPVATGLQFADVQTAAVLQAMGYRLRPDVRMSTYTQFIMGMGMGNHRLAALHPQVLRRRLSYLGEEYIASGVGTTAMTRTCTEPLDASSEALEAEVPPIPPALQPLPSAE